MYDELKKQLQFHEKESKLFIPNEIFNDIQNSVSKGSNHLSFAYTYYYLVTWLYRYTKYGCFYPDNKFIKRILGYSETYPALDYLIKKSGLLDQIGYTDTTKDFPISWTFDDEYLEFDMLSDMDNDAQEIIKRQVSRKYTVKYPVKAFYRWGNSDDMDGTYYQFENTHEIPFEVFLFSMSKEDIGCIGFYLWSYLKMKNQIHKNGYDISLDDLSLEVKIPKSTMIEYLNKLRGYQMITCYYNQEFFCVALSDDEKQANTYVTNEWFQFSDEKVAYQKLKFVSKKEYQMMQSEKVVVGELFG